MQVLYTGTLNFREIIFTGEWEKGRRVHGMFDICCVEMSIPAPEADATPVFMKIEVFSDDNVLGNNDESFAKSHMEQFQPSIFDQLNTDIK